MKSFHSQSINDINSFICRRRNTKQHCLENPTRLGYCGSTILKAGENSQSKVINKKRTDIDDDGEAVSPEVCVGPAKNETHSVRVMYII